MKNISIKGAGRALRVEVRRHEKLRASIERTIYIRFSTNCTSPHERLISEVFSKRSNAIECMFAI
jgi:hypothetical protein